MRPEKFRKTWLPRSNSKGEWHYNFTFDGERHSGNTHCTDKQQARQFVLNLRRKLAHTDTVARALEKRAEHLAGGRRVLIEKAWELFLTKEAALRCSPQHLATKESHVKDFLAFVRHEWPACTCLSRITADMAEAYVVHLRTAGRFRKPAEHKNDLSLANRTVNIYITNLRQSFNVLAEDAGVVENPFGRLRKLKEDDAVAREVFTDAEIRRIVATDEPFMKHLFLFAFCTAMRTKDICLLKCDRINLADRTIKLRMAKTGKLIDFPIMPMLDQYLATIDLSGEYVNPELATFYLEHRRALVWRVRRFLTDLGISTQQENEGRRNSSVRGLHAARHTFATLCAQEGIEQAVVRDLLGHSSEVVTSIYTAHASMARKELAMRKLSARLGTGARTPKQHLVELLESLDNTTFEANRRNLIHLVEAL